MSEQEKIKCPHCGKEIPLSQAFSHDIESRLRQEFEVQMKKSRDAFEQELSAREKAEREKIKAVRASLEEDIRKEVLQDVRLELTDAREALAQKTKRLDEAEKKELDLRQEKRRLEEREKALELEMTRKLDEERKKIAEELLRGYEEKNSLRIAEKDHQIESMRRTIDELKRKSEQGSQQLQGEVLEIEVEELLRREFPFDAIESVAKGTRGGDILQTVMTQSGNISGKILWETKRTKAWNQGWIQKLKDDKGEAQATLAVLVSETLPQGFHHFREIDGVWVTDIPSALSLALALRMNLIQVARARELQSVRHEASEFLYDYVTGPEFKNRVEAVGDAFRALQDDLEQEKTAMQRIWDKRQKQIQRAKSNIAGFYGAIEGLTGKNLPPIKMLELPVEGDG